MSELPWNEAGRAARVVVDLGAIAKNVSALANHISPLADLMAVVKANGYGHGAVEVADAALGAGATWLGVATLQEAAELRGQGIEAPMLVLGPTTAQEAVHASELSVSVVAGSLEYIDSLRAIDLPDQLRVHLKVDTGMNRFGVFPGDAVLAASKLNAMPRVHLEGVMSHLARADEPDTTFVEAQASTFHAILEDIDATGIDTGIRHLANSAATIRFPELHLDMVRTGISIYGLRPSPDVVLLDGMNPAMRVECKAQRVWNPGPRGHVGYGGTAETNDSDLLVLLPVGYGDGYSRRLSNSGWVEWKGSRLDIAGRVSMDQTVVRATMPCDLESGAVVDVMGSGSGDGPSADQIAELTGTISYEVAVDFGLRLPVIYTD